MQRMTMVRRYIGGLLLLLLVSTSSYGQLDGRGIAPNFTLVDITGESHDLYDYLDKGTVVVLDFFAVWCSICKADAAYLDQVYELYGPKGENSIELLSLEGDNTSTDDETEDYASEFGAGNPHINATNEVPDAYQVYSFPTYYVIAPDRSYKVIGGRQESMKAEMITEILNAPPLSDLSNDLRVMEYSGPSGSICAEAVYPELRVQNYGINTITSFKVQTLINTEVVSEFPYVQDLSSYSYVDLRLPWITGLKAGWHDLSFRFVDVNDGPDGDPLNGIQGGSFLLLPEGEQIQVALTTDPYPKETSWVIKQANQMVAAKGSFKRGLTLDTTNVCVQPDGCYTLILYDSFGDGMSFGGIEVKYQGQAIASMDAANFSKDSIWIDFCIYPLSNNSLSLIENSNEFGLYPNPTNGLFWIESDVETMGSAQIELLDMTGRVLKKINISQRQNKVQIDLSDSPTGVYFVRLKSTSGILTKRILLNR